MAMPTYSPAASTIRNVKMINTDKGLRYLVTCNDEDKTQHWFSQKYITNVMFGSGLNGLNPVFTLKGATIYWEQTKVKAGDVVYDDKTEKPVLKDGKPLLFTQDGVRRRNAEIELSEKFADKVMDAEIAESTKAKFSGADLLAMFMPKASVASSTTEEESPEDIMARIEAENGAGVVKEVKGKKAKEPLVQ